MTGDTINLEEEEGGGAMVLYELREIQTKSYKELQALAKLHGVKANLSKIKLIDILMSTGDVGCSQDKLAQDSNSNLHRDNPEVPVPHCCVSGTPGTGDELQDDSNLPRDDQIEGVPAIESTRLRSSTDVAGPADPFEPEMLPASSERRRSERLSATTRGDPGEGVVPAVEAAQSGIDTHVSAPPCPVEPEILPMRRKSERLSATFQGDQGQGVGPPVDAAQFGTDTRTSTSRDVAALPNPADSEILPERRKSERLSDLGKVGEPYVYSRS